MFDLGMILKFGHRQSDNIPRQSGKSTSKPDSWKTAPRNTAKPHSSKWHSWETPLRNTTKKYSSQEKCLTLPGICRNHDSNAEVNHERHRQTEIQNKTERDPSEIPGENAGRAYQCRGCLRIFPHSGKPDRTIHGIPPA